MNNYLLLSRQTRIFFFSIYVLALSYLFDFLISLYSEQNKTTTNYLSPLLSFLINSVCDGEGLLSLNDRNRSNFEAPLTGFESLKL